MTSLKVPQRDAASGRKIRRPEAASERNSLIGQHGAIPYLFSAPAVIAVSLMLGFPVLYALYSSLFRAESLGDPELFVGFANYVGLVQDPRFLSALSRSTIFLAGCVILGTVLGLVFAFALNRVVKRLRFLRAVTIAPYIVSSVAVAVMFRILFNREYGQVNQVVEWLGLPGQEWFADPVLAMLVVIIAQVWGDLPLAILVLLGGLQTIDSSYLDAAAVDGATGWKRARYISIPLITPQLVISTVWLSYTTLTSLGVVLALTGGGPLRATQTLPVEMYHTAFEQLKMNEALAIAVVILVWNAVLALAYIAAGRRYGVAD